VRTTDDPWGVGLDALVRAALVVIEAGCDDY
jgi:hypothetical protein